MKIIKIYQDLDGCLCDFEKSYRQLNNITPREAEKQKKFYHYFEEFIAKQNFATLEYMPDALILIEFLKSLKIPVEILSSTANQENFDEISKQKNIWCDTHNIPWKRNYVPGKRFKYKFATPDSIIIDDTLSVVEDWRKAGGIAIWHKDALSTICQLKMFV
jgi:hypothetical protein